MLSENGGKLILLTSKESILGRVSVVKQSL